MITADLLRRADELIAAPATPRGAGALAVVRLSGPGALDAARALAPDRAAPWPRHAQAAHVRLCWKGQPLDDAVVTAYHAPRSYTGQDVVEFSLHGNPLLVDALLAALGELGARLAEPGEFTLRAVLAGKLDLVQAEAVDQLIRAASQGGLRCATRQLQGALSARLQALKNDIFALWAHVEMALDFPEEDDAPVPLAQLLPAARAIAGQAAALAAAAEQAAALFARQTIVICGPPNAGKSTLFNALLGADRAITSETAGTTRDTLHATLSLDGRLIDVLDTAGLRAAADAIEREGVARAWAAIDSALAALLVTTAAEPPPAEEPALLAALRARCPCVIWVRNKSDLYPGAPPAGALAVSARTGAGLDALRAALSAQLEAFAAAGEQLDWLPTARQLEHCRVLRQAAARAVAAMEQGAPAETISLDVRDCLRAAQDLLGEHVEPDVLNEIFARFCIGK